jgi:hypothetical protein
MPDAPWSSGDRDFSLLGLVNSHRDRNSHLFDRPKGKEKIAYAFA